MQRSTVLIMLVIFFLILLNWTAAHQVHFPTRRYTSAHSLYYAEWLQANCQDSIAKDQWPPNLRDLNPLDCHVWGQC